MNKNQLAANDVDPSRSQPISQLGTQSVHQETKCRGRRMTEKLQDQLAYPPRLMAADRAAAYVGFGSTKFLELVDDGKMPRPIDIDGSKRWDRLDLDLAVENLKDRHCDPVTRDRERLDQRLRDLETANETRPALCRRAA
jgi:predicted DNA-binding transcriptional regulator AlpA